MTVKDIVVDLSKYSNDDYQLENLENSMYLENSYEPTVESLIPCGTAVVQPSYGAPQEPTSACPAIKYSGESINLASAPNGAIGPYHVRFFRMPASGAVNALSYGEIDTVRTVNEGSSTSTSFTLYDTDFVAASGNSTAGIPETNGVGNIIDVHGSTAPLSIGKIRVATTVYDSCPTGSKSCISYCDIALGCVAPTCNFTVL